jgi:hypothetical protein
MVHAPSVSRALNKAGCQNQFVCYAFEDHSFVAVWAPKSAPGLVEDYKAALTPKYHVQPDPRHPNCLLVSDHDSPDWEPRED